LGQRDEEKSDGHLSPLSSKGSPGRRGPPPDFVRGLPV
jgi:hypothetical protein